MNLCCIFFSRYCLQEACDTQIGPFLTHFKVSEDFIEESIFSRSELVFTCTFFPDPTVSFAQKNEKGLLKTIKQNCS